MESEFPCAVRQLVLSPLTLQISLDLNHRRLPNVDDCTPFENLAGRSSRFISHLPLLDGLRRCEENVCECTQDLVPRVRLDSEKAEVETLW